MQNMLATDLFNLQNNYLWICVDNDFKISMTSYHIINIEIYLKVTIVCGWLNSRKLT